MAYFMTETADGPLWVDSGLWRRLLNFQPGELVCSTERPDSARSGHSSGHHT
jgi:hypothetical protein